ncbi:hypothetical protein ACFFWC_08850, partial [Plantactinospora siamensis]
MTRSSQRDFPLEVQLNVDGSAGLFADVAYRWVDELSAAIIGPERAALAALPARSRLVRDLAEPLGPEGALFGLVEVWRAREGRPPRVTRRSLSDEGLAWLRKELVGDFPARVDVEVGNLDETGQRSGDRFSASIRSVEYSPGWLTLSATLPVSRFTGSGGSLIQRRWLAAVRTLADDLNPGFGQISYYLSDGSTAFEHAAPRSRHWQERDPEYNIGASRQRLRGYSWLTILAQELADRLGGA